MENKDKIDFDLNFLDENTKEKPKHPPKGKGGDSSSKDPNWVYHKDGTSAKGTTPESSGGMSDTAKKWAWGIGIVIVISILSSLGDTGNSTSSTQNGSSDMVRNGDYMCSSYNSQQADNLGPTSSEKSSLDYLSTTLDSRSDSITNEKNEVENEYVDEYDQSSIDAHNERVDNVNYKLRQYRNDVSSYETQRTSYNSKIEAYNSYLIAHCTKN